VALQPTCNAEDEGRRATARRCKVAAGGAEDGVGMTTDAQTLVHPVERFLAEISAGHVAEMESARVR
jgi:hypothetical protein